MGDDMWGLRLIDLWIVLTRPGKDDGIRRMRWRRMRLDLLPIYFLLLFFARALSLSLVFNNIIHDLFLSTAVCVP